MKTLHRTDHFFIDTSQLAASRQPRVRVNNPVDVVESIKRIEEESGVVLNFRMDSPHYDLWNGITGKSSIYVGPSRDSVPGTTEYAPAAEYVTAATGSPIWFGNFAHATAAGAGWEDYLCHWKPGTVGNNEFYQTEMPEPLGLSVYMNYYNKVTVYKKRVYVEFTPFDTHGVTAAASTSTGSTALATNNFQNVGVNIFQPPGVTTNNDFQDNTYVVSMHPSKNVEYRLFGDFLEGFGRRLNLASREKGTKLKFLRNDNFSKMQHRSVSNKYTLSYKGMYGVPNDPSFNYWSIDGAGAWIKPAVETDVANINVPLSLPYYLVVRVQSTGTHSNSPSHCPVVRGRIKIRTDVTVLFWDRKDVLILPKAIAPSEPDDLVFEDDPDELEIEDVD